jgi:hypothetical protein
MPRRMIRSVRVAPGLGVAVFMLANCADGLVNGGLI